MNASLLLVIYLHKVSASGRSAISH